MRSPRLSPTGSSVLLVGLLFAVGLALAALGGSVLLPQGSVVVVGGLALLGFLGVQLLVFRLMRLRSPADAPPADEPAEDDDDEWRAWRG